jgi:Cu/Ag efflux protein CusF
MTRFAIAAALATMIAVPAFAQTTTTTTTEYYVVQDSSTKKCTIVDKKPTTTTMVEVGPMGFKTRTEAETGMKTIKVCETK